MGRLDSSDVLRWNTMVDGLEWLPEDGVVLTRSDLERVFIDLRALVGVPTDSTRTVPTPSTLPL